MIKTNNQPRDILYWWDLPEKERKELDYLDTEEKREWGRFFRYRGDVYDLGEFCVASDFPGWHGIQTDSYFSAVLVKYTECHEKVTIGYFFN